MVIISCGKPTPCFAGCILISITTPITFFFYSRMVDGWDQDEHAHDLVCTQRAPEDKIAFFR